MTINAKSTVIHVIPQAVVGVPEPIVVGGTPALRCLEVGLEPRGEQLIERVDMQAAFGPGLIPVLGSQAWTLSLSTEFYGFDDVGNPASSALAGLWGAAGYMRTTGAAVLWSPSTSYTLAGLAALPAADYVVPCTIHIDEIGGNSHTLYDCVAVPEISADSGARVTVSWTIQGRWGGTPITSTVDPTLVIYGGGFGGFIDPAPWVNKDATIALPSAAWLANFAGLATWGYTPGTELVERPDATSIGAIPDGFAPSYVSRSAAPNLSVTLDADNEGVFDAWATAVAVTQAPPTALALPFALFPGAPAAASVAIDFPSPYSSLPTRQGDAFRQYAIEFGGAVEPATGITSIITWA